MKVPLKIEDLQIKRSQNFRLKVDRLNLQRGVILCLAGPNGSGKTTLMQCIAGLLKPDNGQVLIAGVTAHSDLKTIRLHVGFIPDDEAWLIGELSAHEYILLLSKVYKDAGVTTNTQAHALRLAEVLYFTAFDQKLAELSHGNKKKVQLIAGMMHEPDVLVVDELRNGLDPLAIMAAEKLLVEAAAKGACIVVATHDLWWAERVATRVVVLANGSVVLTGPTKSIAAKYGNLETAFLKVVLP